MKPKVHAKNHAGRNLPEIFLQKWKRRDFFHHLN